MGLWLAELEIQRHITRGPYVEFNISGNERRYRHWQDDSLYLDEAVYRIFADCFSRCSRHFNYYGPTKYSRDGLLELRKELGRMHTALADIDRKEQFRETMQSLRGGAFLLNSVAQQLDLDEEWVEVLCALRATARELLDLVTWCIRQGRVLWVLGV